MKVIDAPLKIVHLMLICHLGRPSDYIKFTVLTLLSYSNQKTDIVRQRHQHAPARQGRAAKLGSPSACGLIHGSSSPVVPGHMNPLALGSRRSGSKKNGWTSSSPLISAATPSPPPAAACRATWCTMLAPSLSPARNTRPMSPYCASQSSSCGRDATHRSPARESPYVAGRESSGGGSSRTRRLRRRQPRGSWGSCGTWGRRRFRRRNRRRGSRRGPGASSPGAAGEVGEVEARSGWWRGRGGRPWTLGIHSSKLWLVKISRYLSWF